MLNLKDLSKAIKQVADEKALDPKKVLEVVESAIAAAYKREYGQRGEIIKAKLDAKTGELKFWQVKTVVDESTVRFVEEGEEEKEEVSNETKLPRYNSERHITLEEAKKISAKGGKNDIVVGEEISFPLEEKEDFGRIAAQAAKQSIFQKLRESERESILKEWHDKDCCDPAIRDLHGM